MRETPEAQKGRNAIRGLHSCWVCDDILAMARPWQENITKHKIVESFVESNIGLVLNLQEVELPGDHQHACSKNNQSFATKALLTEHLGSDMTFFHLQILTVRLLGLNKGRMDACTNDRSISVGQIGEHAHCGPGVLPETGFSYDPEVFMRSGIHVCCMSWRDMGVPSLEKILDIVKVMLKFHLPGRGSAQENDHGATWSFAAFVSFSCLLQQLCTFLTSASV